MDQLNPQDIPLYNKLKRDAASTILAFRSAAHSASEQYQPPMRRLINQASTRDTPGYLLLDEWSTKVAPEIDLLLTARRNTPLSSAISKHLLISKLAATDIAKKLIDERIDNLNNTYLNRCYGGSGRARKAASKLLALPTGDLKDIHQRYVTYTLYRLAARDIGITIYDCHAPILIRSYQRIRENKQVSRYKKQQKKRLEEIASRQQVLREFHNGIVARILPLKLDIDEVLSAYELYKNRLESLKPASRTPAKRLALFATATNKIREKLTEKQSATEKLADLRHAVESIDALLVELFDMPESQHKKLVSYLNEYKKLNREAARINTQLANYAD